MPGGAWFVTLHVREAGFFDEDVSTNHNRHRNARIEDYMLAIEEITGRGGWVIRIGDPSMTPLPEMERVIDYANGDFRRDWMDLFCVAEGRFYFGMPSGPSSVAVNFGVPTLGTNWFPLGPWPYSEGDIFLHKLFRSKDDGRILSIEDSLKPPFFCSLEPLFFEAQGIEILDNTPDEIRDGVIEMFDALDGKAVYSDEEQAAQDRYRVLADPYHVGLSPRLARDFLAAHPELIGGKAGRRP
ncbi:MAG TPA: TIGR04372 family glycosyltransferase [Rhodospirillales bacterium]|nr:TIGR04372 family glycosyltransferase [Rhodospirillales bacterium]